jgi:LmbE family N-acetylglucosaminyl deacetylase
MSTVGTFRVVGTRQTIRTAADAADLGTVLGVWAHPDDETYLSGGLMALARAAGRRVVCASATLGEHGTDEPEHWPPDRLARLRGHEATAALSVLGVTDHRLFGLEDGTLADLDPAAGEARVRALLVEVRPDTVVTFGPDGMSGHPDHRTVSGWVERAWRDTRPTARLLQATTTAAFATEFADIHEAVPAFGDGLPLQTPEEEIGVEVCLDDELADLKLVSLRAHASQIQPVIDVIGVDRLRAWFRTERFRVVEP